MPRISLAFFGAAVLYALAGMGLGIYMGATETFTLADVHAHNNLLGWVSLSIMGGFYALAGERAPRRLAWINFIVCNIANLVTLPALALFLLGDRSMIPIMSAGEMLIVVGMLIFGASVLLVARHKA